MKPFVVLLSFACLIVCETLPARAQDEASVPTKRRIVLHGIECPRSEVCADTRPVLDEAIQILQEDSSRTIVVRSADEADRVPRSAVIMDYLAVGDTCAERVQLDGFSE